MRKSLVLALTVLCAAVPAWTTKKKTEVDTKRFQEKLTKDEQVLHALDRLTFGPRPGDIERVQAMGLRAYLEEQLHPEAIADESVQPRLAPLTALTLSPRSFATDYSFPMVAARREFTNTQKLSGDGAKLPYLRWHLVGVAGDGQEHPQARH